MESKNAYRYPDEGDALTIALIHTESDETYWQASEEWVLGLAIQALQACGPVGRMLDLGCGMGRLLPVFSPYAKTLEGLEPDADRCAQAVQTAAGLPNTTVRQGDFRDLSSMYDAVLCSHVLQHIPRADCVSLFRQLQAHTKPGALVIVTTTHTPGEADRFMLETFSEGARRCAPISPTAFDAGAPVGALPVRFFAVPTMEKLAAEHGFRIQAKYGYHFSAPADRLTVDMDRAQNAVGDLRAARDMLYLLKRMDRHG